jgi:quercetin dioxygenase-like cupin family protein
MSATQQQTVSHMREGDILRLDELVNYQEGAVVSRTVVKRATGTITAFAFDAGQGLSEHTAAFDALVQMIEGEAEITISGEPFKLRGGEAILLPAHRPHAVTALTQFKMLLTMIRS